MLDFFFHSYYYVLIFTQKGWGYSLGDFLTKSSGHPGWATFWVSFSQTHLVTLLATEDVGTCYPFGLFYGLLIYFETMWYILWSLGIFFTFWYAVQRKFWQPCRSPWFQGKN
jgi:hypothetical protein